MAGSHKLVSVAIDFGTTFSGYAFSFKHDKRKIRTFEWPDGEAKTPTCVLFNPRKEFHSFGFEAEDEYASLVRNGEHMDWFFFKHFKLLLKNEKPTRTTMLPAMNGKEMLALEVFSAAIKFLKDHLQCHFSDILSTEEIHWVLTVPAIWDDKARQFMRLAATNAGIPDTALTLALEPEAASVYCKTSDLPTDGKYMVLDCGGGTVDIAVHESCRGQKLKAVYRPTGGIWGGIKVDEAFQYFLICCCGDEVVQQLTDDDKIQLQRSVEIVKKRVQLEGEEFHFVRLPLILQENFNLAGAGQAGGGASLERDKLKLSSELIRSFFKRPIQRIVDRCKAILADSSVGRVDHVFMVGGLSSSPLLQSAIRNAFPGIAVHCVDKPSIAVLEGATIYGHVPNIIRWRRAAYSYGLQVVHPFIPGLHDPNKLIGVGDNWLCGELFEKLVEVDQLLEVGKTAVKNVYHPIIPFQTEAKLCLYRSPKECPMYVTEGGCEMVGVVDVLMPDITGGSNRSIDVTVLFGDSELKVEATDSNTRFKYTASFNFLTED